MAPNTEIFAHDIALACLLHDIGKVIQRASSDYRRNHSEIGVTFLEGLRPVAQFGDILESIKYHHQSALERASLPNNHPAYIVCEADNIASGTDRRESDEYRELQSGSFETDMPLHSIFNCLDATNINDEYQATFAHCLRTTLQDIIPFNYPVRRDKVKATHDIYQRIQEQLERELLKIFQICREPSMDQVNLVLRTLENCCCYVPSSTKTTEIPDISLYDHSKITAAVGSAVFHYITEAKESDDFKHWCNINRRTEKFFLMISADLSGVQDFIYTVPSKGAMKSLRTRSFYLDLLLEHVADEILESLKLSRANLLYTGGGHFYMLLPNTLKTRDILQKIKKSINNWFIEKFGVTLYLAIAHRECSPEELMDRDRTGASTQIFKDLSAKLAEEKLRKYDLEQIIEITDPDSNLNRKLDKSRECASCKTSMVGDFIEIEGRARICPMCYRFSLLGRELLRRDLAMAITKERPSEDICYIEMPSPDEQSRYLCFVAEDRVIEDLNDIVRIYVKNKPSPAHYPSINLWIGDYAPRSRNGGIASFEEMEKKSEGIRRLAAMRADVDSLGALFRGGLERRYATISRYATLSRHLSMFFKRYINNVCRGDLKGERNITPENFKLNPNNTQNDEMQGRNLAIVYSGGDDVFVVGAWNEVIEFAMDLRKAFELITCGRLSFSAGIGLFNHSFPVYQMAKLTGELEKKAKENPDKNSVSLFGIEKTVDQAGNQLRTITHTYHWDEFENDVYSKVKFFLDNFNITGQERRKLGVSKAFLYKLLNLLKAESGNFGINIGRLAFSLARYEKAGRERGEDHGTDYGLIKRQIYEWACNADESRRLITALNIIIYMFREPKDRQ